MTYARGREVYKCPCAVEPEGKGCMIVVVVIFDSYHTRSLRKVEFLCTIYNVEIRVCMYAPIIIIYPIPRVKFICKVL